MPTRQVRSAHVTVELIAGSVDFDRHDETWVGIRFSLEPDWHVYWQNPGDSGGPPQIHWRLPEGVSADGITWPTPARFDLGGIVNYGFSGDVVFPVRLRGHPESPARPAVIAADLEWVVCGQVCVTGKASLELQLPLPPADRKRATSWKKRIEQARERAPRPAPAAWRAAATSDGDRFLLRIEMDDNAPRAIFFPLDPGQIDESAPQGVEASGRVLEFQLQRSDVLLSEPQVLRGVVAPESGPSYVVTAPVRRTPSSTDGEE